MPWLKNQGNIRMNKQIVKIPLRILKVLLFLGGGWLFYKNREKIATFIKSQNFIITAIYTMIIGGIALFYRLIIFLNWIIQQAR